MGLADIIVVVSPASVPATMMASAETFTVYQESLPSAKILFCEADVRSVLVQEASTARPAQNNIMRTMLDSKAPEATSTDTLDPTTSSDEGNETPASSQFACPKCATPVQLSVSVSFEQKQAKSKSKATSSRNGDQIDSEDAATPNETVNGDSGEKKNETGDGLKNTEEDLQSTAQKRVGLILTKGTDPPKLVNESEWEKSGQIASDVSGGTPPAIVLKRKRALFSLGDDDRKDDELTILSPGLQQVFKEVVKYYPGIAGDGEKTTLKYPYEPLYFYFDEICAAAESDPNVDAKDLEALVDNYNQWIRPDHDKIRRMIADGNIRYNCLWALFRPGDVVFTWDPTGQARLYILIAIAYRDPLPYVSYDIDPNANVRFKRLVADLWSMGWDCVNQEFQRFTTSRSIKSFTGQCPITSLPFYPLSYYANGNAEEIKGLCQSLQESGQRWRSLVSQPPICQHYTGPARDIASPEVQLVRSNAFGSLYHPP